MISVEDAQALVRRSIVQSNVRSIRLGAALGYVLAEEIDAKVDSPRFDTTSVDGYAVYSETLASLGIGGHLPVTHEISAGDRSTRTLKPNETHRIFTGAPLPNGADAVIMQEDVDRHGKRATFNAIGKPGANLRRCGDEFRKGAKILDAGTVISPPVIGTLAAIGYSKVKVYARPKVVIVVTGNELRPPGSRLGAGQIYDSNSVSLCAALSAIGLSNIRVLHVKDNAERTKKAFTKALAKADFVIATGGVSVGDHDHVRDALSSLGVDEVFWRVRMKPGKPLYFGVQRARKGGPCYVFGLPGNPVSVMVGFALFIRGAIQQYTGVTAYDEWQIARLRRSLKKQPGRTEYIRAKLLATSTGLVDVEPLDARESYMTSSMALADCLLEFPDEEERLDAGALVRVLPLRWSMF